VGEDSSGVAGGHFSIPSSSSVAAAGWGRATARRLRAERLGGERDGGLAASCWQGARGGTLVAAACQVLDQMPLVSFKFFENLNMLKSDQTIIRRGWWRFGKLLEFFQAKLGPLVICLLFTRLDTKIPWEK
jgi:hypothetical protein